MPAKREDTDIPDSSDSYDVAVVGGGIVGLAVAWRARARGLSVVLLERGELGAGTSRVAAGHARAGRRGRRRRARRCSQLGPARARALAGLRRAARAEVSGIDVGYRAVRHARCSPAIATRPRRSSASATLRERFGLKRRARCCPARRAAWSPRSRPTLRSALHLPDDHAADPRLVCAALARAAERAGAVLRAGRRGRRPRRAAGRAGRASPPGRGRAPFGDEARVRPVKGQSLRLRDPAGPGLLRARRALGQPSPATSCRAATGATCSARRRRSAASTPR